VGADAQFTERVPAAGASPSQAQRWAFPTGGSIAQAWKEAEIEGELIGTTGATGTDHR
jgi:hypothetical protein